MGGIREVVAVIVAADSRLGGAVRAIDDLAGHLPPPEEQRTCPLCSVQSWPCARFDDAAHRVQAAGLRLDDFVPPDLHERLRHLTRQPLPRPSARGPGDWFDQGRHDRGRLLHPPAVPHDKEVS